jgi:hypothetical protein
LSKAHTHPGVLMARAIAAQIARQRLRLAAVVEDGWATSYAAAMFGVAWPDAKRAGQSAIETPVGRSAGSMAGFLWSSSTPTPPGSTRSYSAAPCTPGAGSSPPDGGSCGLPTGTSGAGTPYTHLCAEIPHLVA